MKPSRAGSSSSRWARPRRARVAWDEDNLELLEATKSPKQKITEPKTPYHAPGDSDGTISPLMDVDDSQEAAGPVDAEAVRSALSQVSSRPGSIKRKGSGWTSSEDENEPDKACPEHNARFKELRRAHYDEFRKLRQLRSQGSVLQEEDVMEPEPLGGGTSSKENQLADGVLAMDIQGVRGPRM